MTSRTAVNAWARLALVLISRCYRATLLCLVAIALAPMFVGAGSYVIKSGSMMPVISVGDVVIATPYEQPEKVAVGRVYVFDDPGTTRDRLLVHRIVERRDDGDFTTAGDANSVTDATALKTDGIRARAVLLAPYVGLPVVWIHAGQWLHLALWLLFTIAAFVLASRDIDGEPPKWTLLRLLLDRRKPRTGTADDDETSPERDDPAVSVRQVTARATRRATRRALAPIVTGAVLAVLATGFGTANAGFTARTANGSNTWTVGSWSLPYVSAVLADRPHLFWLLDDTGPTWAADHSGNNRTGRFSAGTAFGQAGGLPNNPGTSIRTGTGVPLATTTAVGSTTDHTAEMWLNTTSTTGGYLAGFESSATSTATTPAAQADRILRMDAAGRITYGDWNTNPVRVITTPRPYNDGDWHHVVVVNAAAGSGTFGQSAIYVDGIPVAFGQTSKEAAFTGFWHIGGGSVGPAFTGRIDNVSIYTTVLPAARVAEHYRVR